MLAFVAHMPILAACPLQAQEDLEVLCRQRDTLHEVPLRIIRSLAASECVHGCVHMPVRSKTGACACMAQCTRGASHASADAALCRMPLRMSMPQIASLPNLCSAVRLGGVVPEAAASQAAFGVCVCVCVCVCHCLAKYWAGSRPARCSAKDASVVLGLGGFGLLSVVPGFARPCQRAYFRAKLPP